MIEYQIIRSKRKTLAIYVKKDGSVIVRAPLKMSHQHIEEFIEKKILWIEKAKNRFIGETKKETISLSPNEVVLYKEKAVAYIKSRCPYFSQRMGVHYNKISINKAKTRWGSCSSMGNLNFSYRLLFLPPEAIDYVIVHELAHLKEMNHSKRFWKIVENIMPDYNDRRKVIREFEMKVDVVEAES